MKLNGVGQRASIYNYKLITSNWTLVMRSNCMDR